jgi:peptidoglycan/LPS O-acetylase OafA/YrhL
MTNLDDLMAVWQSQDAAPLHDVNKTLLHLALRQDEAKLQKEWRIERWITYVASAGIVAVMAIFLAMMIYARKRNLLTGWDFAIPLVGAVAAVVAGAAMYLNREGQVRREQRFGESLRDQLNRRIAQLDDRATRGRRTSELVLAVMGGICPIALVLLGLRVNQKSFSDEAFLFVGMILICVWSVAAGVWSIRRQVQRDVLPRKRRLEAVLKELDAP